MTVSMIHFPTTSRSVEQELQELYQRIQQTSNDDRDSLQAASANKMREITQKIVNAVKAVGDEGKYVYIMDVTGGIPYISKSLSEDVTKKIREKLGLK